MLCDIILFLDGCMSSSDFIAMLIQQSVMDNSHATLYTDEVLYLCTKLSCVIGLWEFKFLLITAKSDDYY